MWVRLEVYLPFRGAQVWKGDEELPEGATPASLLAALGLATEPDLAVLVNGRYQPGDRPIPAGSEVAILRQCAGGL